MDSIEIYCAQQLLPILHIVQQAAISLELDRRMGSEDSEPSSDEQRLMEAREAIVKALKALTKDA